jgi:hypothetical protein
MRSSTAQDQHSAPQSCECSRRRHRQVSVSQSMRIFMAHCVRCVAGDKAAGGYAADGKGSNSGAARLDSGFNRLSKAAGLKEKRSMVSRRVFRGLRKCFQCYCFFVSSTGLPSTQSPFSQVSSKDVASIIGSELTAAHLSPKKGNGLFAQAGQTRPSLCTRDQRHRHRRPSGWIRIRMTFDGHSSTPLLLLCQNLLTLLRSLILMTLAI